MSESNPHVVDDLFWNDLLGAGIEVQEDVLQCKVSNSDTIDHNKSRGPEPDGIKAGDFWIAFDCCIIIEGWDGVHHVSSTPPNDGTIGGLTDGNEFFPPMIILVIHMIVFEPGLGHGLGFEEFELFLKIDKIRGTNKGKVKIVTLEDIIDVESLNLVD